MFVGSLRSLRTGPSTPPWIVFNSRWMVVPPTRVGDAIEIVQMSNLFCGFLFDSLLP